MYSYGIYLWTIIADSNTKLIKFIEYLCIKHKKALSIFNLKTSIVE